MHQIKTKTDQLGKKRIDKVTQDRLEEYGLSGRILRPYQLDGVSFMTGCYIDGHGCILGDEMGLGKTMQVAGRHRYKRHYIGYSKFIFLSFLLAENVCLFLDLAKQLTLNMQLYLWIK